VDWRATLRGRRSRCTIRCKWAGNGARACVEPGRPHDERGGPLTIRLTEPHGCAAIGFCDEDGIGGWACPGQFSGNINLGVRRAGITGVEVGDRTFRLTGDPT
jgi:hypothetical protein